MIGFNEQTKVFHLSGKTFSYAMFVNQWGYLQFLHFGGRVSDDDLTYLSRIPSQVSFSPTPSDITPDWYSTDIMPQEFASFGQGDFRSPTAMIEQADGACLSRFKYVDHSIYNGVPQCGELPCARAGKGAQTLAVRVKDAVSGVEIILNYTVFHNLEVLVRNAEFVNVTNERVMLKKAFSFCLDLPAEEYEILRLYGRHLEERIPERTPLGHGLTRISSERTASSHQMNPFTALLSRGCTEQAGGCYGVSLVYSGSFAITAEVSQMHTVRLQGGVNDFAFGWRLNAGERFIAPQAVLAYSGEGLGGLSRAYADFYRERIILPSHVYAERPIVVNNWEATYFNFDTEKLCSLIDEAQKAGIDTFVLDDGWFGKRDTDSSGLGDWTVNTKKLDGGLKKIISHCKKKGLKFGLWFEPEMISKDSDLYRAHPDWAIAKAGVEPCRSRRQLVLDFTRPEIVDEIYNRMEKILSENDISYVKWDMNRHITENYSAWLAPDGQGEFSHRYTLGVYRLADRLTKNFPDVLFEGCSGGGGRFDAGMLYYFPQIWTSDDTDACERARIQYGTSIAYPLSAMSCHVSACPNHQTGRTIPLSTRGAVASLGATGYELDLSKLSEEEKTEIGKQIRAYKRVRELILKGDFYRLSNPFRENYFCGMVVSKDKTSAYVVGEKFNAVPYDAVRRIRLQGLDKKASYEVEELGIMLCGDTLENGGLLMPELQRDHESWVWHLTKK